MKTETYIVMDIESDGPIPGEYSILSLGAVAMDQQGKEISHWYGNFHLLPNATQHPDTMKFWSENQHYYLETRINPQDPVTGMKSFHDWVTRLPGKPVAVAAPAGFDFTFVYWYLMKFVGHSVFSFSCVDMKTLAMSLLRLPYKQSTKRNYPSHWFNPQLKHTHHALMDAQEQAYTFAEMLKELHSHV